MALQRIFPFRRVSVDRMVHGVTRVWWQLEPVFQEIGPYVFQLQVGGTGTDEGIDWQNVGAPITNGFFAEDTQQRASGTVITTHYRVTLTTPDSVYVSAPASCFGQLGEKDWLTAREIIRKERLRHGKVSVDGYLIKALRYGKPCPRCRDVMTQEATDNNCPVCLGTGYESGFHPPVPMQCWDLSPQIIQESQDLTIKGTTRENAYVNARVIGFPALNRDDVWVNASTDERWLIKTIQVSAAMRGVPLIYNVQLGLLPFNSSYYQLGLEQPTEETFTPKTGSGCVAVGAGYLPGNALKYADANGDFITGAIVYAFTKADFDASYPTYPARANAVATARTTVNGAWETSLNLDPGQYVLVYEKADEYGPDHVLFTVTDPCAAPALLPCSSSESACSTSSATVCASSSSVARKKYDNFWEI